MVDILARASSRIAGRDGKIDPLSGRSSVALQSGQTAQNAEAAFSSQFAAALRSNSRAGTSTAHLGSHVASATDETVNARRNLGNGLRGVPTAHSGNSQSGSAAGNSASNANPSAPGQTASTTIDPAPADTAPVGTAPVDTAPVDTAPIDTAMMNPCFSGRVSTVTPAASEAAPVYTNEVDAYWGQQPAEVQVLRTIDDENQRIQTAMQLSAQGYSIDVPIMVWRWDPLMTMRVRQEAGYTWVPAAGQSPVDAAPGFALPGMTPYDSGNAPSGAIQVSTAFATGLEHTSPWYRDPNAPPTVPSADPVVGFEQATASGPMPVAS